MTGISWTSTIKLIGAALVVATMAIAADGAMAKSWKCGKGGHGGPSYERAEHGRHGAAPRRAQQRRDMRASRHYLAQLAARPARWHIHKRNGNPRWYARNVAAYFNEMPPRWHRRMHRNHPAWYHRNVERHRHYRRSSAPARRSHHGQTPAQTLIEAVLGNLINPQYSHSRR